MANQELFDQIARLPCWSANIDIMPLVGGMTNRNFVVTDSNSQRFVVRVGRDLPEHGVLRFNELAAAHAAFAAGISPEVIHAGEGIMVSRFIDGHTLKPEDVRVEQNLIRVIDLIRACHLEIPRHFRGPALMFWVFQVIRHYLSILEEPGKNQLDLPLHELTKAAWQLEQMVGAVHIVFGHNDLLAANLIDDGQRLWLIDWDYAGFNSPLFDLANLSTNNAFTPELESQLLETYFGSAKGRACHREFAAMKCASLLREWLWAAVSHSSSSIAFDYAAYAEDYRQRYTQLWLEIANSEAY